MKITVVKISACFIILVFFTQCKPVQKSYLPYRKKNKCGCPTYGLTDRFKINKIAQLKTLYTTNAENQASADIITNCSKGHL